jgi:hypothetical protein
MLCGNVGCLPVEGTHCSAAVFEKPLRVPQIFCQLGAAELRGCSPTAAPAAVVGGNHHQFIQHVQDEGLWIQKKTGASTQRAMPMLLCCLEGPIS